MPDHVNKLDTDCIILYSKIISEYRNEFSKNLHMFTNDDLKDIFIKAKQDKFINKKEYIILCNYFCDN